MNKTSSMNLPRIWMNVSTSVNWNRPPVGIVRVEQELFKALSALVGDRLRPCVLQDGKFVRHVGPVGTTSAHESSAVADGMVWPDPSYDFPASSTLELVRTRSVTKKSKKRGLMLRHAEDEIQFGDVLISVGLDWDWDQQRLDSILHKLKTKKDVKVVTCCYDLIPVLFPHYCVGDVAAKFKEYFTNLTWASSAMLCISKRSESDYKTLATNLGMPQIPTRVMLLGNKLPEPGDDISGEVEDLCAGRFILFVSTIERRKNHEAIYKALHILGERGQLHPDMKIVFVGMPGWGVGDLLKDIELDPVTKGHIVQLRHANDAELRALYENCEFFVYPSLYEGWGLPVAEALAFGKFVIASNRGSIPEVGGDLVEYVDPWNASAWADALSKYFNDPELLRARESRIREEYHPIHWGEAASTVLDLIEEIRSDHLRTIQLDPGYSMQTQVGVCHGARIVSTGEPGVLCYGPYCPLPEGSVRITIYLDKVGEGAEDLKFKFSAEQGAVLFHSEKRTLPEAPGTLAMHFNVRIDHAVDDFEVVVISAGNLLVAINKVEIQLS
jgi:glycosyltransferase involved in cell wall biosynthesis